jgi:hypothetical protein
VRTDLDDFLATIGQPGGIAQLDANGILVAGQGAGYYPVGQNLDGTYNARPAVPWPILWVMRVPGSSLPDNDGSVLGGGGMIEGLDGTIDLTVTFGS